MPRKIDPLNKKLYGSVTAMLTVTDVKVAAAFYQKAFGFAKRGIMNGPDGKAIHAELTLRGTTLMLGPEMPQMGSRAAKTIGASPTSLYLLTENADKTVAKAVKFRRLAQGTGDGYVLGRPLWNRCRSRGLHLDGRYPHCTTHTQGIATEDEGTNGEPTGCPRCEWLLSSVLQAPLTPLSPDWVSFSPPKEFPSSGPAHPKGRMLL